MIELDKQHLDTVVSILRQHVPDLEVRAFGSRVAGTAREFSDLDLALVGAGAVLAERIEVRG
jgi:predicted nucleotidyltransferase